MKFFNLSNDHLFKLIFSDELYLKYILKEFFNMNVDNKKIEYLNTEILNNNKFIKYGIVDMLLKVYDDFDEEIILFELQNINRYNFVERLEYYAANIKSRHCLEAKEDYIKLKKMKVLAIINYDLGYKNILNKVSLMTKDNNQYKIFNTKFNYQIYNLSKINNKQMSELEIMFKKDNLKILEKNITSDIGKEILSKIKYYNLDRKEHKKMEDIIEMMKNEGEYYGNAYMAGKEDGYNTGKNDGFTEGISQGIEQNKTDVAKNMLKEKIDINIISKVTNIPIEQIQSFI